MVTVVKQKTMKYPLYSAVLNNLTEFYSYHGRMPGRVAVGATDYKYSVNGQERDKEIHEDLLSAEYWEYDARLGKRWNTDPVVKPWESSYLCFSGNPIVYTDIHGDDAQGNGDKTYSSGGGIKDNFKRAGGDEPPDGWSSNLPEINVKPKSWLSKIGDWFADIAGKIHDAYVSKVNKANDAVTGSGGTQKGGMELYGKENGNPDGGTKVTTKERDVKSYNIDYLLAYVGSALKSAIKAGDSNPLNPATIFGDGTSVEQEVEGMAKNNSQTVIKAPKADSVEAYLWISGKRTKVLVPQTANGKLDSIGPNGKCEVLILTGSKKGETYPYIQTGK